jgi:Ankyrin repeats (3 copies)
VTSGDERAVTALLANGADVNETTSGGQTPLILAVIFGHTNIVELLVRAGADPELRDNLGLNAIEWASRRGSTDALDILTNPPAPGAARKPIARPEEPQKVSPEEPEAAANEPVSNDDRSRRWIAGLKQRLDEQELRRLNRNEPPPERPRPVEEPAPPRVVAAKEPPPVETINPPEPEKAVPATNHRPITTTAVERPAESSTSPGKRKRCPKCNAIYNSDLLAYCAYHVVPLVDADEPIISEPPKRTSPLFWLLLVITFSGSLVAGSLLTRYLFSNTAPAPNTGVQQSTIQKGVPELGGELAGKAVSLPEAECPLRGPEPVSGSVMVSVKVDKDGKVYWARGAGGDWLMRGAATEAAMKSTFAPEKLRRREAEGTITYTFTPQ